MRITASSMSDLKDQILSFIKDYNLKEGKPPSIKTISKKVKGVTVRQFYKIFPGGIKEACSEAGIQAPSENIKSTQKALNARREKQNRRDVVPVSEAIKPDTYTLSEPQMLRLRVISHLEKGKSPNKIIDELLEFDSNIRLNYKLNLDQVKTVNDFLNAAQVRGFEKEQLLDVLVKVHNAGFYSNGYDSQKLSSLVNGIELLSRNNSLDDIIKLMEDLLQIKFNELTPREKIVFKNIISDINKNKITSEDFLKLGNSYVDLMINGRQYLNGKITLDELIRRTYTS